MVCHACMQGPAKNTPKLPAKLFDDFRPHGAIFVIALRLHQIKKSKDIRRIDFANAGMRRQVRAARCDCGRCDRRCDWRCDQGC